MRGNGRNKHKCTVLPHPLFSLPLVRGIPFSVTFHSTGKNGQSVPVRCNHHKKGSSLSYHHHAFSDSTDSSRKSRNYKSFSSLFIHIRLYNAHVPFHFLRHQQRLMFTHFLQNACQCLRTYAVGKFCYISIPNPSCCHIIPFSLVHCREKNSWSPFFLNSIPSTP